MHLFTLKPPALLHPPVSPDLLNAWVYAIAVEEWTDMAVVIDDRQMAYVECGDKDPNNATTKGWDCLFRPMPHVCTFGSIEVNKSWTFVHLFFRYQVCVKKAGREPSVIP